LTSAARDEVADFRAARSGASTPSRSSTISSRVTSCGEVR
jgi:hypothetical protein